MDQATVDKAFVRTNLNDEQKKIVDQIEEGYRKLAHEVADLLPDSREKSLAITNLQQSKMWAIEAVAKN